MAVNCLTVNGVSFQVDEKDKDLVDSHRWHAYRTGGKRYTHYVMTEMTVEGRWVRRYLHRLIMNAEKGTEIDHVNGDGLDNRRSNLRPVTHRQNHQNLGVRVDSGTGVRGVEWRKDKKCWRAYIRVNGRNKHLGHFYDLASATEAARSARERLFTHSNEERSVRP